MSYKVKVYLPTQKKSGYVDELKNSDILTITKYIKANDDYGLSTYLKHIVQKAGAKNIIDMFFVILQLRALNFNNNITLKGKHAEGTEATYKQNIFEFLGEFINYVENIPLEYTFEKDNLKIILTYPKKFYFKNFFSLLINTVQDIKVDDKTIFENLTPKEKFKLIYQLKDEILRDIKTFFDKINCKSELFFIKNDNKDLSFPNIRVSFFNNTVFSIIKSIFKIEISYFYNKLYVCLTKLGITFADFMNLTYIESDILLTIYKSANKLK